VIGCPVPAFAPQSALGYDALRCRSLAVLQHAAVMAVAIRGMGHRCARAPHSAGSSHAAQGCVATRIPRGSAISRIRPEYAPADPCDRLVHLPGEQVQCDLWFPGQLVPDHAGLLRSFPVLVMVAAYSRFIAAVMIPSRVTGDLLAGMWQLVAHRRSPDR
jgi:hypothetical protein